jgi:hypothetical protein
VTVNVAAIATRGQAVVESAIASSKTRVTISRDADDLDQTVDLDTLDVTDTVGARTVVANVRALITAAGPQEQPLGPNRAKAAPTYVVLLPVAVTDVQDEDVIVVTESRDPLLKNARLTVTAVLDAGVGVVRTLHARRI